MLKNFKNLNTPGLWDKRLFETNEELLASPYYLDKINRVLKFLSNKKGKFLDIGFGMGNLEKRLLNNKTDLELYGIDFSPKAVARAKENFKGEFVVGRSQKLPFGKRFFDFVVMLDVLEHIPKSESKKVLDEINRIMKKGGYFVISVPLNENIEKMNREGTNYNKHLRQYTSRILERELQRSGFEVMKCEFIYAFRRNYFLKNLLMKFLHDLRKPNVLIMFCKSIR